MELSKVKMLDEAGRKAYKRVEKLNKKLAEELGWRKVDIELCIFGTKQSAGYSSFIDAVLNWQDRNGFKSKEVDGIVGKKTFRKMLEISPSLQKATLENWKQKMEKEMKASIDAQDLLLDSTEKLIDFLSLIFDYLDLIEETSNLITKNKVDDIFKLGKKWKKLFGNERVMIFYTSFLKAKRLSSRMMLMISRFQKTGTIQMLNKLLRVLEIFKIANAYHNWYYKGKDLKAETIVGTTLLICNEISPTAIFLGFGDSLFGVSKKLDTVSDILSDAMVGDYYEIPPKIELDYPYANSKAIYYLD